MQKSIFPSVRACLTLISFALLLNALPCMAQKADSIPEEYGILINAKDREISGLCVMDRSNEGNIVGTIVNEFGIKIFDFSYSHNKTRIQNVIAPLDRWHLRRIIRKDMHFILENISNITYDHDVVTGMRSMKKKTNGDVEIYNRRYKIIYTFTKLKTAL